VYSYSFYVDGDTLVVPHEMGTDKYIHSDIANCSLLDRYATSTIDITPSEANTSNYLDDEGNCNLLIGKLRKDKMLDSTTKVYPDSMFIQYQDVWIRLEDIGKVYKMVADIFPFHSASVVLHSDKNVPDVFLADILDRIPDSVRVYKAVTIGQGNLGVLQMK
jgi:hypothetical protein